MNKLLLNSILTALVFFVTKVFTDSTKILVCVTLFYTYWQIFFDTVLLLSMYADSQIFRREYAKSFPDAAVDFDTYRRRLLTGAIVYMVICQLVIFSLLIFPVI